VKTPRSDNVSTIYNSWNHRNLAIRNLHQQLYCILHLDQLSLLANHRQHPLLNSFNALSIHRRIVIWNAFINTRLIYRETRFFFSHASFSLLWNPLHQLERKSSNTFTTHSSFYYSLGARIRHSTASYFLHAFTGDQEGVNTSSNDNYATLTDYLLHQTFLGNERFFPLYQETTSALNTSSIQKIYSA